PRVGMPRPGTLARDEARMTRPGPSATQPRGLARPVVPTALYDWVLWPGVALLPESIRQAYGFRWGRREDLVSRWLVAGWRAWNPLLPATFRQMPQALAADRRISAR